MGYRSIYRCRTYQTNTTTGDTGQETDLWDTGQYTDAEHNRQNTTTGDTGQDTLDTGCTGQDTATGDAIQDTLDT